MNALLRRRGMISAKEKHLLPAAYQQVEWIGQTGGANINTGLVPTNGKLRIKLKYLVSDRKMYGVFTLTNNTASSTNTAGIAVYMTTANRVWICSRSISIYTSPKNVDCLNKMVELDAEIDRGNSQNVGFSVNLSVNGSEYSESGIIEDVGSFATGELRLFGWMGGATYMTGRIYSCELWDSNVKARSLIPCYRKSDSVIGMFDTVSNTFFTNAGSGSFTKGADV